MKINIESFRFANLYKSKKVIFTNYVFHQYYSLLELYSKADVCFFPSVGESFGLVVIEAMASGCAVVSTIPLEYKGFTVKPGDTRSMAQHINYLMNNPKKAHELGKQNIKLSKKYTWKNFTDKFVKLYKELI